MSSACTRTGCGRRCKRTADRLVPKIRRTSSGPRLHFSGEEVWLLGTVVENLQELLADGGGEVGADGGGDEGADGVGGDEGADGVGVLAGLDWATSPVERPD